MDPPIKPDESDCCNSGCNPCILDVYEEQLKKYKQRLPNLLIPTNNCISPTSYTIFKFMKLEQRSKHTFLFTFEYSRPKNGERETDVSMLYKPGQHLLLKGKIGGEEFTRAYTPISTEGEGKLRFTALIKLYEYGIMSSYLKRMQPGTDTLWRGPYGDFVINYDIKHVLMVAQGTGIAPIYSIINDIVQNEDCYTFMKLFFCCSDCENIYLREELYKLSTNWNFTYEVFLSKSDDVSAKYNEVIHIKKLGWEEIRTHLRDKYETVNVLICGSDNFMNDVKNKVLDSKVKEENVYTF